MRPRSISVDPLSLVSLLLEVRANGHALSTATGFVVKGVQRHFLVTNWHVVTGRNPETGEHLSSTGAVPDEVEVFHHCVWQEGGHRCTDWLAETVPLLGADGRPSWIEHPRGSAVDVIAIPIQASDDSVIFYPLDLSLSETDLFVGVASAVSIVGYPFGLAGGAIFPIWKTGHVASEPEVDFGDRPMFLIDATTRSGMSGAPVYSRFAGYGYKTRRRVEKIGPGTYSVGDSSMTRFLGVYAGRIHDSAELGRVWRPEVLEEILPPAVLPVGEAATEKPETP